MKRKTIALTACGALLALAFLSYSREPSPSGRGRGLGSPTARGRFVPDRLLVKFKDVERGLPAEAGRAQAEHAHNLRRIKHFGLTDVHLYRVSGSLERTLKALAKNPNVLYAEPDYLVELDMTVPNDTSFGQLWGMHNTGQSGGTVDADIDAPEAWDLITGNPNVVVAVIDTGVAYTHPDLAANMWTNPGEVAGNGLDDDGNGYIDDVHGINSITGSGDPMDDHNHGTHCAGTIASVGNNGAGVAGVCWTARIMALKFLAASGTGSYSDAIECIQYAVNKGAHILSNSWGGYDYGQSLKNAIDAAASAGLLFVAAAGNDGTDNDGLLHHYPSSYSSPNIIAVAATNRYDQLSVFTSGASNYGAATVDVAAPGSLIYSTIRGNTYGTMSGTSMATPHVAGLAALIKSYNYALDWMQIKERILGGVDPLPALQGKVLTGGRINAYNSLLLGDVASYLLNVTSAPATGAPITVSPADLDGASSGTTAFTRRYAPYASVTLTAPATHLGLDFGYWAFAGYRIADTLSATFPVDFDHTITAHYLLPLADAVDNSSLEVITGGHRGGFFGQLDTTFTGGDAAQSCDIGDSESGYLQTSIHGPGNLSFYWKVSSESGSDTLGWSVDGAPMSSISGEADWAQVGYTLVPGAHVIRWTYTKNAGGSSGSDCGWVDDVRFDGEPATLAQALDLSLTPWQGSGDGGWFHQATIAQYDGDAAQSGPLADNQRAYLETMVTGPSPLSFYWKVSSEEDWDFLQFYIDGVLQSSISGEVDWTPLSYSLGSGAHTLRWSYVKDANTVGGSDCGWVDHVVLAPAGSHTLTLTQGGTGSGQVKVGADPAAHDLPYQETFAGGTAVALEAVPDGGSVFASWSGGLVSTANPSVVTMATDKDVTANFETTVVADLTVTSPNGGERWTLGSTHPVTWTQSGVTGTVTIALSKAGSLPETLGTADAAAGSFSWMIDPGEIAGADYRVSVSQGTLSDASDGDFELAAVTHRVDFNGDGQEDILWRYQGSGDYQGLNVIWLMGQTGGGAAADSSIAAMTKTIGEGLTEIPKLARMKSNAMKPGVAPIRTILKGGQKRVPKPGLIRQDPFGPGRRPSPMRRGTLGRNDAADPGILGSDELKIASLSLVQEVVFSQVQDTGWEIAGTGDFNGDTKTDILWRYYGMGPYQGLNDIWFMDGTTFIGESVFSQIADLNWRIVGTRDFNGDGQTDILWRYYGTGAYQGLNVVWFMNGAQFAGEAVFSQVLDTAWKIEGTGDFNADGETDILWRYYGTGPYQGLNDIWFMNDTTFVSEAVFSQILDTNWQIGGTGDFNNDGQLDILWRYYGAGAYQGLNDIWYMNGITFVGEEVFSVISDTNWRIVNR